MYGRQAQPPDFLSHQKIKTMFVIQSQESIGFYQEITISHRYHTDENGKHYLLFGLFGVLMNGEKTLLIEDLTESQAQKSISIITNHFNKTYPLLQSIDSALIRQIVTNETIN